MKTASLTPKQRSVIIDKGTDRPFVSTWLNPKSKGTFLCRQCGLALFRSHFQFASSCGWPSFDDEIPGSVLRVPDPDGMRTEIICQRCQGHLGHVFQGEGFTSKNLRHCVNQTSLDFVHSDTVLDTQELILAGGCFWGVQHELSKEAGVLLTEVGYCGGHSTEPNYDQVCSGTTAHVEAVRVIYDPQMSSDKSILKAFFELHNPFQMDGQGADIGSQYLSVIFFYTLQQHQIAQELINQLENKYKNSVATQIRQAEVFWPAEDYHQDFFNKNPSAPVCHKRISRF